MGAPVMPPVAALDSPEPLTTLLARDKELIAQQDCLPCKLTGATAFIGLGVYSYITGHKQLLEPAIQKEIAKSWLKLRPRQMGITGLASAFIGMGIWRLVN